jgi:hypothetical protein
MPLGLARLNLSLFALALAALLLPAAARAQTTYSGGGASFPESTSNNPSPVTSTINVTGAPGTVATVKVVLLGVKSDGESFASGAVYNSLAYAEFLLEGPGGEQLVLLGQTGDTIDGCDQNQNADSCDGLQGTTTGSHPDTITIEDGAHSAPNGAGSLGEQYEGWQTAYMPYTVEPSSYYNYNGDFPPPLPTSVDLADYPQTDGTDTLNGRFGGTTANGTWTLYLIDNNFVGGGSQNDPFSITGWNLILTFAQATTTTTTLSSNASNPAFYANSASSTSITYTATLNPSSATGTVTFQANGSTISGCSGVALSGGVAHCSVSLAQGANSITAAYTPTGNYGQSDASMTQLVEVTPANPSGTTWCNNSLISIPGNDNPGLAYPSVIGISDSSYNGKTVGNVTVELEGIQGLSNGINGQYLLVGPGGGSYNLDFMDAGFTDSGATSAVNLTFEDSASETVPYDTGTPGGGPYLPTDNNNEVNPDSFPASNAPAVDSAIPQVPGTINFAPPYGTDTTRYTHTNVLTFGEAFNGASANGKWSLYSVDPSAVNINSGWCITLDLNTGTSTTTTLTPSSNPATTGQSLTFTATVTAGGDPVTAGGTVTFLDNGVAPAGTVSGNNVVTLNGGGVATFSTSSLAEGDHMITANYSGVTNEDNESFSAVLHQRINTATTVANVNSDTWKYCDPGAVQGTTADPAGPLTPNPSNIFVTNLPGTLNTVTIQLNSFSVPAPENLDQLATLLEGPTGAALDFFSNTTQGAGGYSEVSPAGNFTFEDAAAGLVPVGSGNSNDYYYLSPGTYKPTAYESYLDAGDTFTSSASGFYPAPTTFHYAGPTSLGSDSTFADVFTNGSNANGRWSLFFNTGQSSPQSTMGAAGGWCVNLTENLPSIATPALAHVGTFAQGESNAQYTVNITNSGTGGPTGDPTGANPMTVTDTLNGAFAFASGSGTGWTCSASGQTVTCKNDSAVADNGGTYPELTINVNVANGATGSISNQISASGAGVSARTSNTDTVTIEPAPVLSVAKTHTGTFTQGSTAQWNMVVSNAAGSGATSGTTNVSDTLPSGYSVNNFGSTSLAAWSCSGTSTVSCSTTAGLSEPGGSSFPPIQVIVNVPADSPTSVTNTALAWGGGDLTHTSSGTAASGSDSNVTVVQVPESIAINGSGTQSTQISTAFGSLAVTVKDAAGVAVPNSSVTFTAPSSGASGTFSNSSYTITESTNSSGVANPGTFTANGAAGGPYSVSVTDGPAATSFSLTNDQAPSFTTANNTTFEVNLAGSFSITASPGYPTSAATLAVSNVLNAIAGVNLPSSGTGSITLSGTPTATGTETFTTTATNGAGLTATQNFTLTVVPHVSISPSSCPAITLNTPTSCSLTASGGVGTSTLTVSNVQNAVAGLNVSGSGTGAITIGGTPTATGIETFTITATDSLGGTSVQNYTLTVDQAPAFTSANNTTFTVNTAGTTFGITATGFPAPVTLAVSNVQNAVPGINVPSSGTGTLTISGTPTATGIETFTITATNGAGQTATQNFTLTVDQAPAFTSANNTTFTVGTAGTFTLTSTGFPTASLSETGALPSGVTFVNNGNGTATLAGTPGAGTGGAYNITVTAQNGVSPNATQSFTLTISQTTATVTLGNLLQTYSGAPLSATATTVPAGLPVSLTYNGSPTAPTAAGSYSVVATVNSSGYTGTANGTLVIAKAPLTVTANNASMAVGAALPALTYTITGFLNTDTSSVVGGTAAETTTATSSSPAGTYPISFSTEALTAANYTFTFVNGTLSVVQAPAVAITAAATLTKVSGGYKATVTVTNTGTGAAANVQLTTATLGSATGSPLPQNMGTLAAGGGSATVTVTFPASAGSDGATVAEKYAWTYTGGSFSYSLRAATLP